MRKTSRTRWYLLPDRTEGVKGRGLKEEGRGKQKEGRSEVLLLARNIYVLQQEADAVVAIHGLK